MNVIAEVRTSVIVWMFSASGQKQPSAVDASVTKRRSADNRSHMSIRGKSIRYTRRGRPVKHPAAQTSAWTNRPEPT